MAKKLKANMLGVGLGFEIRKNRMFVTGHNMLIAQMKKMYEQQIQNKVSDIKSATIINNVLVVEIGDKPKNDEIEKVENEIYDKLKTQLITNGFTVEEVQNG